MPANKARPMLIHAGLAIGLVLAGTASVLAQDVMQPPPDVRAPEPIKLPDTKTPDTAQQPTQTATPPPSTATTEPQTPQH